MTNLRNSIYTTKIVIRVRKKGFMTIVFIISQSFRSVFYDVAADFYNFYTVTKTSILNIT